MAYQNINMLCRLQYGKDIECWFRHQKNEHAKNIQDCRTRRVHDILQRIHAEGYDREVSKFNVWSLPGVKTNYTKELTDQGWEERKPRILAALEYKRQKDYKANLTYEFSLRLDQLSRVVTDFYYTAPQPVVIPSTGHFARMAPFVDLLKNTPIDKKVADSEIQDLTSRIPLITESWRESADKRLLDLLPQKSTVLTRKVKAIRLKLATTFFKCPLCRDPIPYPQILMHNCLTYNALGEDEDDVRERKRPRKSVNADSVWRKTSSWYGTDWNKSSDQVTFDNKASGFAQVIVKVYGKDPGKATFDQMNDIDAGVECVRCRKRRRLVMKWTTAIMHGMDKHFEEPPEEKDWLIISKEDVKDFEAIQLLNVQPFKFDTYMKRPLDMVRIE